MARRSSINSQIRWKICEVCDSSFRGKPRRRCCTQKCARVLARRVRRKLPSLDLVKQLYVLQKLTLKEIAARYNCRWETVRGMLHRAKVRMRPRKKIRRSTCSIEGCDRPIKSILHAVNKCVYGTMCTKHRRQHRASLSRWYRRKRLAIPESKWRYQHEASGGL